MLTLVLLGCGGCGALSVLLVLAACILAGRADEKRDTVA